MNYKGMDANMQCRGFQYEVGKEYETDEAVACEAGFHACEYPLDVFKYYPPAKSRYAVVEQSGKISKSGEDTKVASTKIKIAAEIGIAELVRAAVVYTKTRAQEEPGGHATGYQGAASATGDRGAASATGKAGVALAAGFGCKAKGALGCAICVVERGNWDGETYPIINIKAAIVDGDIIKADTYYRLINGEFVEA